MNEKIKRLLQELEEECEKSGNSFVSAVSDSEQTIVYAKGDLEDTLNALNRLNESVMCRLIASGYFMNKKECDCPDCKRIRGQTEDTFEKIKFDEGDAEFFKSLNRKMRGV